MYAGNCAFCLGGDKHEDCKKVTQVSEHKRILLKYGRCFNCIREGHVSIDYETVVNCNFCKGKQHSCLCCPDSPGEGRSSETAIEPCNVESVGSNMHIETGGSDGTMEERHSGFLGFRNIRNHRKQQSVQGICR